MPQLNLKPSHKAIRDYYATLQQYDQHAVTHEGAVSNPFAFLLDTCAKQVNATLIAQYAMRTTNGNRIVIDGAILDEFGLPFAYWEAKDIEDDLPKTIAAKQAAGYPLENTCFQTPHRIILYQNGQIALDLDITEPAQLIAALQYLFAYVPPALDNWQTAVADFREHVPDLANRLKELIDQRHETDPAFKEAFADFYETCRAEWTDNKVRTSLYRPFTKSNLFFDRVLNNCVYLFPSIFPTPETEAENRVIIVSDHGFRASFNTLMTNLIPDLHTLAASDSFQCFPFYTYDEDGNPNRQENITDWALSEFRTRYNDDNITKWDIFHYTYALLHHPIYREKYEMNLKRDLPHIPFTEDFWGFANAGAQLADLHINYESVPKNDGLTYIETPGMQIDWRLEKMRLSKDKTQLRYNDFLTLDGIPTEVYDYKLGNRSALEWVIDQYRVKVDKRSRIVNDPNRAAAPRYIVDLIARVITVSLKTVEIVDGLPPLENLVARTRW